MRTYRHFCSRFGFETSTILPCHYCGATEGTPDGEYVGYAAGRALNSRATSSALKALLRKKILGES
jgi:hypothetical protein